MTESDWRQHVPKPVFEQNAGLVELYWKAWELAHDHIKHLEGLPQSPYMDEAFSDTNIWIWDTCFMAHFCKYAADSFPGIESLKNFYAPMHDGVTSPMMIHILDNPPLFAWTEIAYYKLTADHAHLDQLLHRDQYLQKHFKWFDTVQPDYVLPHSPTSAPVCLKRIADGYFWEGGRSGMDNTVRGRTGAHAVCARPNNPDMLWVDAVAQQGLSALCIARMANALGDVELAATYEVEYEKLKCLVNDLYWNEEEGIYYDIHAETKAHMKVKTPASFWPMLAEMCTEEQAARLVELVKDPTIFGGPIPWVSLARNDADFCEGDGDYWRGGVWLPTAYMGIKALAKYGYDELAAKTSLEILEHMLETYRTFIPHTIWECYNPSEPVPAKHRGKQVRPDFCGWSALGPISLFIEDVLGFQVIDAAQKQVVWWLHQEGRHGIQNLYFGDIHADMMTDGKGKVSVSSSGAYTLIIHGHAYEIEAGTKTFQLRT
ncbi:trehalase family glycosidase [Kiritimatiellota bacterium B12222]|nr:trehalase family glycosidase [Kiritimatiellota bacterium B12222]